MGSIAILGAILCISFFGLLLYVGTLAFSYFFAKQGLNLAYRDFYECGFKATPDTNLQFDLQYAPIGLIFLIYEMEIILFLPLFLNFFGFNAGLILLTFFFIIILGLSYWYEWERYALTFSF